MKSHNKTSRPNTGKHTQAQAQQRPMQGIDQKAFVLNDIFPINFQPSNDAQYSVIIQADANGYTWTMLRSGTIVVAGGTSLYGVSSGQFDVQAMFYSLYYTKSIELDITLSSGGSTYSMSPTVHFTNPNGLPPFQAGNALLQLLSAPATVNITEPYRKHTQKFDYGKWLVANQNRAWRKTISANGLREPYATDNSSDTDQDFTLPTLVRGFQFTVPAGTFDTGAGQFTVGLVKIATNFMFSQRRVDIGAVVQVRAERIFALKEKEKELNSQEQAAPGPLTKYGY